MLRELAAQGALPGSEIMWILDARGFAGDPEARRRAFMELHEWLVDLAELMPLPPEELVRLAHYAAERLAAGDEAGARQALAVVLRSPYAVQPPLDVEIRGLTERVLSPPQTRKMSAKNVLPVHPGDLELLGLLARSGAVLTDEQRRMVLNVVERSDYAGPPRVHFAGGGQDDTRLATRHVIVVSASHLLALSRFIIGTRGEDKTANHARIHSFLQQAAADAVRAGVPLERIREVWTATAIVRRQQSGRDIDAAGISDGLRRLAQDRAARRAETEIAKAALSLMPKAQSGRVVDDLRRRWRLEQEPEARLALAEIIVGVAANR